jgi:Zn-dependent M28 family amino/carboxypeptidase
VVRRIVENGIGYSIILIFLLYALIHHKSYAEVYVKRNMKDSVFTEEIQRNLKKTVYTLAREIGPRSYLQMNALNRTVDYIKTQLVQYGCNVSVQTYNARNNTYENIYVVKKGTREPEKIVVIGAHYDTVSSTPGADDNASGIAGLLELARLLHDETLDRTVHFVAFALEEPPFFRTRHMGSYVYAHKLSDDKSDVVGMICLESMGYFRDEPDSQMFPLPFLRFMYPRTGNYITFVSDFNSKSLMHRAEQAFKKGTDLPVETIAMFSLVPGIDFSDHRSFWKFGYDAIMVTDTAFYRNPNYHGMGDVPETLDYERLAEVVLGLKASIVELAGK